MSQDKPVLSRGQIEEIDARMRQALKFGNLSVAVGASEWPALRDMALSALDRQGWIMVPKSLLRAAQLKCVDVGVQEAIHNFLAAPQINEPVSGSPDFKDSP
jgi:hypothetical protein